MSADCRPRRPSVPCLAVAGRRRAVWLLLGVAIATAAPAAAAPIAHTYSETTIGVYVRDTSLRLTPAEDFELLVQAHAATTSFGTSTGASQGATDSAEAAPPLTLHAAFATAELSAVAGANPEHGSLLNGGTPVFWGSGGYQTSAISETAAPLFARAHAEGAALLSGVWLSDGAAGGPEGNATLDIMWDFGALDLTGSPGGSLAYVRDTLSLLLLDNDEILYRHDAGFMLSLENGQARVTTLETAGSSTMSKWFENNLVFSPGSLTPGSLTPGRLGISEAAPPLVLSLSVPATFVASQPLDLLLFTEHAEHSAEAPPKAVPPVLMGFGSLDSEATAPRARWGPNAGVLSIDPVPIETLLAVAGIPEPAPDDPILGGTLILDDLRYIGTHDGQPWLTGGSLNLRGQDGATLLHVDVPLFGLDDTLFDGLGLNLFAPILADPWVRTGVSPWLDRFFDLMVADAARLPVLFLGLSPGEAESWAAPFDVPVELLLAFAGGDEALDLAAARRLARVPLPPITWLFAWGLVWLIHCRRRQTSDSTTSPQRSSVMQ